jgi:hypothetical protein
MVPVSRQAASDRRRYQCHHLILHPHEAGEDDVAREERTVRASRDVSVGFLWTGVDPDD